LVDSRPRYVGFRLDDDVADFIKSRGHARHTDLATGKINFSAEVNDFIRGLMGRVKPEAIGYSLVRRREELRLEIEAIDRQAQELLGVSTIDEWIAREKDRERSQADVLETQREIRDGVRSEILSELRQAWSVRHQDGRRFPRDKEATWAEHRFRRELKTLGMSPEEFVRRMQRESERSPEVA